ncbi:MAG: choline/carnitine O-acyltransferase [Geminicoccaceae bacterium]
MSFRGGEPERPRRLPLPPLDTTLDRYLAIVRPLLTETGFAATQAAADAFRQDGRGLQRALRRIAGRRDGDYVGGFWRQMYLERREPLAPFQNCGLLLRYPQAVAGLDLATRAALLAAATMAEARRLRVATDDGPFCARQPRAIFGSTRLPGAAVDRLVHTDRCQHIVVACRGRLHRVAMPARRSAPDQAAALGRLFRALLDDRRPGDGAGVLTTLPRSEWRRAREQLLAAPGNRRALTAIERSAFLVCLEPDLPGADRAALCDIILDGDAANRWYDKVCQIIVPDGPYFGVNAEHTPMDGHAGCALAEAVCSRLPSLASLPRAARPAPAREIRFDLAAVAAMVEAARAGVAARRGLVRRAVFDVPGGTGSLRDDVMTQLAVQLAYRTHAGEVAAVYQPTHMRRYRRGRTEAVRSATAAAIGFAKAATDETAPRGALRDLARQAVREILERGRDAQAGRGVDRHLYALFRLAEQRGEMPALFADPAYAQVLGPAILCTSSLAPFPHLELVIFAPVRADGFGIGYVPQPGRTAFCLTGYRPDTPAFAAAVAVAMRRVRNLLTGAGGAAP